MRIHYIEDSKIDIISLTRSLRKDSQIFVTASTNMKAAVQEISEKPCDIVLLDAHRPDSVSIEDDISALRSISQSPVIVFTGLGDEILHKRALRAGAEAMLVKGGDDAISSVRQVALNAFLRRTSSLLEEDIPTGPWQEMFERPSRDQLQSPYPTLYEALDSLGAIGRLIEGAPAAHDLALAREFTALLLLLGQRDFSEVREVDALAALRAAIAASGDLTTPTTSVSNSAGTTALFFSIGGLACAVAGFRALLLAGQVLASRNILTHIEIAGVGDGQVGVVFRASAPTIENSMALFSQDLLNSDTVVAALRLAAMMFSLRPGQATVWRDDASNVMFHL